MSHGLCHGTHFLYVVTPTIHCCPLSEVIKHIHQDSDQISDICIDTSALDLVQSLQRVPKYLCCLNPIKAPEFPILQRESSKSYQCFRIPGEATQLSKNPKCCLVYTFWRATCRYNLLVIITTINY